MKARKLIIWLGIPMLCAASLLFVPTGCEKDGETSIPDITGESFLENPFSSLGDVGRIYLLPESANISWIGEEVLFTVDNGDGPFTWSVAVGTGTITPVTGNSRQATYTVVSVGDNTVTVRDPAGQTATATIGVLSPESLLITPESTTLNSSSTNTMVFIPANQTVNLIGVGGVTPYVAWTVAIPGYGTVVPTGPSTATYTLEANAALEALGPGVNTITLVDSDGNVAHATVTVAYKEP